MISATTRRGTAISSQRCLDAGADLAALGTSCTGAGADGVTNVGGAGGANGVLSRVSDAAVFS